MIKIGQIIDSETKGLHYLEDYKGKQYVIPQLTMTQSFDVEVIEFDGKTPVRFIESKTLILDLNNLPETIDFVENIVHKNELTGEETIETINHMRKLTIREALNRMI